MIPAIPDDQVIQLWWHYEEVAMHFNGLILQYRIQVLAALGALGAVAAFFAEKKKGNDHHALLQALLATGLLCIFASAVAFDLLYYNRLLQGAVDALLVFEHINPGIYLSTCIAASFGKLTCNPYTNLPWAEGFVLARESTWPIFLFAYGLIFVPLSWLTVHFWGNYDKNLKCRAAGFIIFTVLLGAFILNL